VVEVAVEARIYRKKGHPRQWQCPLLENWAYPMTVVARRLQGAVREACSPAS